MSRLRGKLSETTRRLGSGKNERLRGVVQLDAAGLLFLLFITGVSISMAPSPSDPSTQRFWLAGLMHALPLLTMLNIPWWAPLLLSVNAHAV